MKLWKNVLCCVFITVILLGAAVLIYPSETVCCLCDSVRYHAPCLIDLETGALIELDLFFPREETGAETPSQICTFSLIRLGTVTGTKQTGSGGITLRVPASDKTNRPVLCNGCKGLLKPGYDGRYVLADLYDRESRELIPIAANTEAALRCYEIRMAGGGDRDEITVTVTACPDAVRYRASTGRL